MVKRPLICLVNILLIIILGGCWSYQSLDQMSIVAGITIDYNQEENTFDISYETADLAAAEKKSPVKGKVARAQGKTLFDAARNAKRRDEDRFFFGSSFILVLNQDLVRNLGISSILEWFLRDAECRESLYVAISQENTAAEILEGDTDTTGIMSMILHDIIKEDPEITGSTVHTKLYQIYNRIYSPRKSALLPVLHKTQNGKSKVVETNGVAVIKEDLLVGFLTPEQTKYCLMIENELKSAIIPLSLEDQPKDDISLEIFDNTVKKSFSYENGQVTVYIDTETDVAIAENQGHLDTMEQAVVDQIEQKAAQKIAENIESVVSVVQRKYEADVFGLGEMIYKQDLKLWTQLSSTWDEIYPTVEVKVSSKVNVVRAAFIK